tara:strand:+ start:838 stop:1098 length:261 start_codon:yes stop_codon:yes gene_type:complete
MQNVKRHNLETVFDKHLANWGKHIEERKRLHTRFANAVRVYEQILAWIEICKSSGDKLGVIQNEIRAIRILESIRQIRKAWVEFDV